MGTRVIIDGDSVGLYWAQCLSVVYSVRASIAMVSFPVCMYIYVHVHVATVLSEISMCDLIIHSCCLLPSKI